MTSSITRQRRRIAQLQRSNEAVEARAASQERGTDR